MKNKKFGYARVSSKDQNEIRQILAFKELGIDERDIYIDKKSGKDFEREQYKLLKSILREGDLLVIHSIDRLGRNYQQIVENWKDITKNIKADILVLDMKELLDTRKEKDLLGTFINDLILGLLSYVAQTEREKINTRQREGIDAYKKTGITKTGRPYGRPKVELSTEFVDIVKMWKRNEITARKAMEKLEMKPNSFYKYVKEVDIDE